MITTSQQSVTGTAAVLLATVPPGPCAVTITNGGAVALYVGAGTGVTASTGVPVPASGVVPLPGFAGSSGVKLWALAASGTVTAGVIISNGM